MTSPVGSGWMSAGRPPVDMIIWAICQALGTVMSEELSVNLGEASPRRLLVTWANEQDGWVRLLTAETILSRQEVSNDNLTTIYQQFLAEKALVAIAATDIPQIELDTSEAAAEESLELTSIDSVVGVNALAPDQTLTFDPSLTILFGQNGSGKTGYARILKRISAVRTPEDILPNAHATPGLVQPTPSAHLAFELAGDKQELDWNNEAGLSPFTRISVFDASAVSLHVDSDLGYVYTPAELALFSHVSAGVGRLQQRIAADVSELRPGSNPLLSSFTKGTKIYPVIESLGPTTELAELTELATVDADAEVTQARLQDEVGALRGNTLDAVLANAQHAERDLKRLSDVLATVAAFDAAEYSRAHATLEQAEARRREAREQLFSESELPGAPDEDWQQFVVAADAYRSHLGLDHYPADDDQCLYCRQPLDSGALDLVRRYRTFLDETLVQQVTTATRDVDNHRLAITDADLQQSIQYVAAQATLDKPPAWAAHTATLLTDAQQTVEETASRRKLTNAGVANEAAPHATTVVALYTEAKQTVAKISGDKANAATLLNDKQGELAELTASIDLKRNLATARDYVQRAKRAQRLEQLSRDISNRVLKQLTVQSKLASEDLVNKNFEALFTDECARLRAPKVALRFQGRSGKAERKKVVAQYRPSAVLSEGEQKVLAIADFLAESRMRGTKAPLVFDDPVTSLDYRRLDEVAGRIQELAQTHQVIVLTHNIMFASALISARQNKKLRVKIYEVRDGGASKGILAPDVEPQLDTVADLAKRVNAKLQAIKTAEPVLQDAFIKEAYDLIRAWCEAFVEQELLQNVTQRYRNNIIMTRLKKIDSTRIDAAVAAIGPLFERACDRMTGHSHAAEYLNTKPTVAELEEDWANGQAARHAYIGK